ncbi:MAG: S-layer homology domain-containing protein [Bacillota bacterium]
MYSLKWITAPVRTLFSTLVMLLLFLCLPQAAPAALKNDIVLESRPVAYGLTYEKRSVNFGAGPVLVYILRADLTNQYLKVNTMVGSDGTLARNARVTDMAAASGAVAAVNADFFQMGESGRPIGMTYKDGRMITSPPLTGNMFGWAINRDGTPVIDLFSFSGQVTARNGARFPLSGVNKPQYLVAGGASSHQDALLMYDRLWGTASRGRLGDGDNVTEVFVSGGSVVQIRTNQPGAPIPESGYVLAGRGKAADFIKNNIKQGDNITINHSVIPGGDKIWAGTGGWSLLADKGRAMGNFPSDINGPNARTAFGHSRDKKTLSVITVEKSSVSRGLTLDELAEYIVYLGIDRALNLDGGGSTTLAVRPLGEERPVLVNKPQRDTQRFVPTALGFFSSAPGGSLAGILLKGPEAILPGDLASFRLYGYDSYYNPISVEQEKVIWSVISGPGRFEKNVFTSGEGGTAVISAGYGGSQATKTVKVLGREDFSRIVAEPSSIVILPGNTSEIKIKAVGTDGAVYDLSPNRYNVSVDSGIGRFESGKFVAADAPSSGEVKITFSGHTVKVPVKVGREDQSTYRHAPGRQGSLTLGGLTVRFGAGSFSSPATVTAQYGGELSGPIPGRYRSLAAITLQSVEGPASLGEPAILTWKYQSEKPGRITVIQFSGGAWQELPSRVIESESAVVCRTWRLGPVALVRDESQWPAFSDMQGHWAAGAVSRLAASGIVSGYPGNVFDPSRKITRAEFAVLVCKMAGWQPAQGRPEFGDQGEIPEWARGYIMAAVNKGVISGYKEDGTFRPARHVTRAEMAAVMARVLSVQPAEGAGMELVFTDGESIPPWAVKPVSAVVAAGVMRGDNENNFRAGDSATRAESAVLIDNALSYLLRQ